MRKLLLSLCMVLALVACKEEKNQEANVDTRPIIKVGASLPLTGNLSYMGISAQRALQFALDKWSAKDTKYKYELLVEDDSFDTKRTMMNTSKLVYQDKFKAFFTILATSANVASTITKKEKIIHMTSSYGSQPAKGFYNFNNMTQYDSPTDLMLKELKRRGIKSIGLLVSNNIGSFEQSELLEKKIKEDGSIKIIGKHVYNPGTIEFRMIIQKMIENGEPDIFYIDGLTPDATLVAKYLKEVTGKVNLTTINDFIETPKRAEFEGLWFVESASGTDEFNKQFVAKFGEPVFLCGANLYDNLDLFIEACEKSAHCENNEVVKLLLKVGSREGAIGKYTMDSEGIIQSEASIKVIKNGKPIEVKE